MHSRKLVRLVCITPPDTKAELMDGFGRTWYIMQQAANMRRRVCHDHDV